MNPNERERWFRCNPSALLETMSGLKPDEGMIYLTLLFRVYSKGGPVKDTARTLSRRCGVARAKAARALELFMAAGRVVLCEDGRLDMPETHEELAWQGTPEARRHDPNPVGRRPPVDWQKLRAAVFARDGLVCAYCETTDGPFEVDHVVAHARGGSDDLDNLTTACAACNRSKGAKSLAEWFPTLGVGPLPAWSSKD